MCDQRDANPNAAQVSDNVAWAMTSKNPQASYPGADHDRVEHNMTNHAPSSSYTVDKFESLRRAAKLFAHTVVDVCPESRERSLALTDAEAALMWAVAAVARNQ